MHRQTPLDRLDQEIQDHLDIETRNNLDRGMDPVEARRAARLAFGNVALAKQEAYNVWHPVWLQQLLQDLRFATRQLSRSPGFTATATGVFALGVAASLAIFAFVDAALVKPLPYRDPSRLVALFESTPVGPRYHISYDDFIDFRKQNRVFTSVDVFEPDRFTLKGRAETEQITGARVSDGFLRTLGISPFLGRDFNSGEDQPNSVPTVMLSYGTWQRRFAANRSIVGQTITLDGNPNLVVGVLPPSFHFAPVEPAEFWATPHGDCRPGFGRDCHRYYGVARLKDGASITAASADLAFIAQQIAHAFPKSNRDRGTTVLPLSQLILGEVRPILIALLCGAFLLLTIGFVNVSSLLLLKAEARRREIAVRGALGASRARLARQFVVEGVLLAVCGASIGVLLGLGGLTLLSRLIPIPLRDSMPFLQATSLTPHVAIFAAAVMLLGGIVFSTVPAIRLFTSDMQRGLTEGGRTAAGRTWRKVGATLVVMEFAVAMVLLISAGLLEKSFYRLLHVNVGISSDNLALLHVAELGNTTEAQQIQLERAILSRIKALPGVTSVGTSYRLAVGSGDGYAHFRVAGRSYTSEGDEANDRMASVGYFETLHAQLLQGRYFTEGDGVSKPRVAVVNQTLAKVFFPGEDPLGKHIINEYDKANPLEVVGVIADIKEGPLDVQPSPAVYASFEQRPESDFFVTARSDQSALVLLPSMISAIHTINPGLVADQGDTMTARINQSQPVSLHRSAAWIISGFASLALLLGTIGLYGVVSYSVEQRTREIGVRVALGASRSTIYRLILYEAGALAVSGVALGALCSLMTTRFLRSMLFSVSPWDMESMAAVAVILVSSALLASYLPARKAASLDPVDALRSE